MSTVALLDQFDRLHADILAILDRARPHLGGRDAGSWTALAPFRGELTAALHALEIALQRDLIDPILRAGGPAAAMVRTLKADCIKLGFDYQAYQRTWAHADIDARWAEYRLAGLAMMRHMREQIAAQDVAIRALCDRAEHATAG
ncbi:hypothetical protein [Sphingomonas sp. PAMC 26605]|uniref:hypothetical protein n=1 Tax=Sphingomonas sp. PAMC 26605 TaxID=1112214 RepID=UPI0004978BB4|nr:hypothetical protein [Sphingomonas sp. PAMC 26605]